MNDNNIEHSLAVPISYSTPSPKCTEQQTNQAGNNEHKKQVEEEEEEEENSIQLNLKNSEQIRRKIREEETEKAPSELPQQEENTSSTKIDKTQFKK